MTGNGAVWQATSIAVGNQQTEDNQPPGPTGAVGTDSEAAAAGGDWRSAATLGTREGYAVTTPETGEGSALTPRG